jgi:hypothetical protein
MKISHDTCTKSQYCGTHPDRQHYNTYSISQYCGIFTYRVYRIMKLANWLQETLKILMSSWKM